MRRSFAQLFREYALVDLKHYKSGAIALRWRTEDEVIERRGELTCGGLRCENHRPVFEPDDDAEEGDERPLVSARLVPYQLDFAYEEDGQPQRALVKAVLCDSCARKLNYKRRKQGEEDEHRQGEQANSERRRSQSPRRRRDGD